MISSLPQTADTRKLHILFIIDQLCEFGGAERALLQTIHLLPNKQFRKSLVTFALDERLPAFRHLPCPHLVLPLRRTYDWNAFRAARTLRGFIRDQRVDIVHTFHETADLWGGLVTRMKGGPVLVSSRRDMGILRKPKHQVAYRLMRSRFDLVLAVSEQVRRFCIEHDALPEHSVATLYNGVALHSNGASNSQPDLANRLDAAPVVVTVGNIRKVKGIDVLVQTAASVAQVFPKVLFVVVGAKSDPEYFQTLETQIERLGVHTNVRFVGRKDDVIPFLKMADVFFLPSRSEGFSNALIEAMACGLPCVATDVGGNAEAIDDGHSGFLAPSEDPSTCAAHLLRLLREPALAKIMGAAGRRIVEQRFTTQGMIDQLVAHYENLLRAERNRNGASQ
jgi:L-malate glycosyltransferase